MAGGVRPVRQRNWMHQLRTDAVEIFGTVAAVVDEDGIFMYYVIKNVLA